MMTAEPIKSKEAAEMGMIFKCYSDDEFEKKSWKLACKLAKMPTKGLAFTKNLNSSFSNNLEQQLNLEKYQIMALKQKILVKV